MDSKLDEGFRQAREMILNCEVMHLGSKAKCGAYSCCEGCKEILGEEEFNKIVKSFEVK